MLLAREQHCWPRPHDVNLIFCNRLACLGIVFTMGISIALLMDMTIVAMYVEELTSPHQITTLNSAVLEPTKQMISMFLFNGFRVMYPNNTSYMLPVCRYLLITEAGRAIVNPKDVRRECVSSCELKPG